MKRVQAKRQTDGTIHLQADDAENVRQAVAEMQKKLQRVDPDWTPEHPVSD